MRTLADQAGLRTMGYVFDSIYVVADCEPKLTDAFLVVAKRAYAEHGLRVALKSVEGDVLTRLDA